MSDVDDRNRRSLFRCAGSFAVLLTAEIATSSSGHAEEVDPFAAMDAAISAGLSSGSPSSPSTAASNSSGPATTTVKGASPNNTTSPSSPSSDLEKALKESQRRKSIDPRTHG